MSHNVTKFYILVIVKDIEGHEITEEIFDKLRASFDGLSEEKILWAYSGLLMLVKHAFRHPTLKKEVFRTELQELRYVLTLEVLLLIFTLHIFFLRDLHELFTLQYD